RESPPIRTGDVGPVLLNHSALSVRTATLVRVCDPRDHPQIARHAVPRSANAEPHGTPQPLPDEDVPSAPARSREPLLPLLRHVRDARGRLRRRRRDAARDGFARFLLEGRPLRGLSARGDHNGRLLRRPVRPLGTEADPRPRPLRHRGGRRPLHPQHQRPDARRDPSVPGGPLLRHVRIGAAAKVASTLAMVNDHANVENRAQLMAFFDLVTFGGLVAGFGSGFLALKASVPEALVLGAAGIGVAISTVLVLALVRETDFTPEPQRGTLELLRTVLRNRDIRRLLPVYVPVVALYGYVLTFTDHLIGSGGTAPLSQLLIVVGSLGVPRGLSLAVSGRWSDRTRRRRPFMGLGLACFGGLAILLAMATGPEGTAQLASQWPLIAVLAAGAGTFPPAALAYLGDIVERAVSGTTFGIYSIIFGTVLIIGPILGGALTDAMGALAYFAIGGFAMFFGLFFVVFLRDVPELLYLCGPVTIIPGTIAIVLGVMQWRREQVVIEFANWAKSQRRIKMDVMAQRIGKTRFETEKLLGEALDDGLIKGVIDRSADEFVVQEKAEGQEHFVGACPNCGGNVDTWFFPEERVTCPYC